MMIDLAPGHKLGLVVQNPVLLAGGSIGCGEAAPRGLRTAELGAVVVGPLMAGSRAGSSPPRLAHTPGGLVLESGLQNRGVSAALRRCAPGWPRLGCPVVAQLAAGDAERMGSLAARLHGVAAVAGLELLLPPAADAGTAARLVAAAVRAGELPVWAKLPLASAPLLAPAVAEAGAVGLVVAQPPPARALRRSRAHHDAPVQDAPVRGALFGPAAAPLMFEALARVAALALPAALIACGGIHTVEQARQALLLGAQAVQIDSALWVEPGLPNRLAAALAQEPPSGPG